VDEAVRSGSTTQPSLASLTLPELRAYRHELDDEEIRVSYWRRLIQARADLTSAGGSTGIVGTATLCRVLADDHARTERRSILRPLPDDDTPPLADIAALWGRLEGEDDEGGRILLVEDLLAAEARLSAYRKDLHQRIDAAAAELISRYRAEPRLCLAVLPLTPQSRSR